MVRRVWVLILLLAVGVEAGPPKGWAVRVLDAEGGPASGTLTVVGFAERHELTLGKNGVADLEAADIYALERYRVFARRGEFCTRLVTVPPRGKGLELRLEPGGVFEATVSDRAGKTIAGAELAFFVISVPSSTPPLFSARTGKDGTVRIAGLPLATELQAVVVGYRGGLLLGGPVKRDKGLRWSKPGEVQKGDVLFDPPAGRVVRYRFECAKPKVDLPDSVVFHAVGDEEAMSGSVQVEKLPAEALVFVPKDCPPLLFQLGLIGDQRATDMQPGAGGKKKAIVFSGESVVVVRARDPKGRPLRFGAWHVRVWFLENGESKRYPRESSASAGDGLHVVKLRYPRELLGMQRHALRFELRAGKPRSECYPAMPGERESVTVSGPELLRRLRAGKKWQVDLRTPVLRKPVFLVCGPDKRPVGGVEVEVHGEQGVILTTRSGADGLARCDTLPAGKVAMSATAKAPWFGEMNAGGAGFRGSDKIPLVVFRTRPFAVVLRTPTGPIEPGTEISVYGEVGGFSWRGWKAVDDAGKVMFDVPLALEKLQGEVLGYSQSFVRPLRRNSTGVTIDLLERVRLWITTTGRREGKSLDVDVVDPKTGKDLAVSTRTSSDRPEAIRVTLPARPLRIAVHEAYNDDRLIGVLDWDGKAQKMTVALKKPALHKLRIEFVDGASRPLPGLKVSGEWSGEGHYGSLNGVTDGRGVRTIPVVSGWVWINPGSERHDLIAPGYGILGLQVFRDSSIRVPMRWWQVVRLALPPGTQEKDYRDKMEWRLGASAWTAIPGVPWRAKKDPAGQAKFGFRSGARAGRIELRIRGQVFALDYPGRPVDPPLFTLR